MTSLTRGKSTASHEGALGPRGADTSLALTP